MNSSHDQNLDYMMLIFLFGPPVYNQRFHVTHIWFLRFQWNSSVYTYNNLHAEVTSGCGRKQHIYTLKGVRAVFRSFSIYLGSRWTCRMAQRWFIKISVWFSPRFETQSKYWFLALFVVISRFILWILSSCFMFCFSLPPIVPFPLFIFRFNRVSFVN